jgi:protein-disulfide isomerase
VLETYPDEVKLLFKNYPLPNHEFANKAATAALAAEAQGKFWEYHDLLFEDYDTLDNKKITEIASRLALNLRQFDEKMRDPQIASRIRHDREEGLEAGVVGTPTLFINGRLLRLGQMDNLVADISAAIDKELESGE